MSTQSPAPCTVQPAREVFTIFQGMSISIDLPPKEAYEALCTALGNAGFIDWETNTYTTQDNCDPRPTSDLW